MFRATGLSGWLRTSEDVAASQPGESVTQVQTPKNQAEVLQSQIDSIKRRLDEVAGNTPVK